MGEKQSSVSQVMGCPQLVSMIAERLGRRDRARCCAVSKLWAECCKYVSHNVKQLGYVLAMRDDKTLLLCNPNTGEEHVATFPLSYTYVWIAAVCQGLVLISADDDLIIGEPLTNQWKHLPRPDVLEPEAAGLRRTESGGVELIAVNTYGDLDKFDFQDNCWRREADGSGRVYVHVMDAVYHGSSFYVILFLDDDSEEPDAAEVWQYDSSSAKWTKMEHGHVLGGLWGAFFLESQGRLLIYMFDSSPERKSPQEHHKMYELVDGKVVEAPGWLDAANALDSSWCVWEWGGCCCMDDELFWITSSGDVVKHCRRDMSFTKLLTAGTSGNLLFSYFPDEGEALSQFHLPSSSELIAAVLTCLKHN